MSRSTFVLATTALVFGIGSLASAQRIDGSGRSRTESRSVGNFTKIDLKGASNVEVALGPNFRVSVTADDNLINHIETRVVNGQLVIGTRNNIRPKTKMLVKIVMPRLEQFDLNGAGNVRIDGLSGAAFTGILNGAGNMTLNGRVDRVTYTLRGAGNIHGHRLIARDATATLNGAGNVELHASNRLNATVNGAGNVLYTGSPQVTRSVRGAGRIVAKG
jgi:hypothetical protein